MFTYAISVSYRMVLIVSAFGLLGYSLLTSIGFLGLFSQLNAVPLVIAVSAMAKFTCLIVLSLVSCSFLVKKARHLKTQLHVGNFALFAQILSIIGLLFAIPWLYYLMNASHSWFGQMMATNLGVPFDFWVYFLATGIILHEIAAMTTFTLDKDSDSGDQTV